MSPAANGELESERQLAANACGIMLENEAAEQVCNEALCSIQTHLPKMSVDHCEYIVRCLHPTGSSDGLRGVTSCIAALQ